MRTYRELEAWQQAMLLVERCYKEAERFPLDERFGLTDQLRRAAISVPSNIAEGSRRLTSQAFINHLGIALGSLAELETCIEIAMRLGYMAQSNGGAATELAGVVGRLLNGLVRALRQTRPRA